MSGGMKKRLSLAIAMLSHPELLLLDEPLAALDLLVKNGILIYLKQYVANGGSIILATHETSALDICTSIYSLKSAVLSREELSGGDNSQYINILLSEK
jgi:ABC-type multidrug transport system ATPase subunit